MNEALPLPHDEVLDLLRHAQKGENEACEKLVLHNVALVKSIVKKFIGRGVEFDDLYQIGCLGLVKAIKNYDETYNVRFSTYAVPMIAGEIKRFLRDDGMIRVSRSLKELATKAAEVQERLQVELGREPYILEVAEALNTTIEEVSAAMESMRGHVSIYDSYSDENSETTLLDRLSDEKTDQETSTVNRILLKEIIGRLEPRERQLIVLRYFQDKTQAEIAHILGVSQVQISRLESRILNKLRNASI